MAEKNTAQYKRTKANKIRRLKKMLIQNPENQKAKERLEHWEKQA